MLVFLYLFNIITYVCGFIGTLSYDYFNPELLNQSNKYIECRGPDSKVSKSSLESKIKYNFIFNRLSILDLADNANQPMQHSISGNFLMFNGEIYNHKELRNEMIKKGVHFKTSHSDTEVILNGIEKEGLNFIPKLRGQFSIFYFDINLNRAYLIRDRLGQKPLYYYQDKERLIFSSNLTSILKSNKDQQKISESALDEYLRYGVVSSPRTIFKNYYKVEPANILEFHFVKNTIITSKSKYWEVEDFIDNEPFNIEEFLSILENSVTTRAQADVPVASFLSGGLDSTTITKFLSKHHKTNTFSVTSDNSKYDESVWSNLASKKYNTNHKSVNVNSDISSGQIIKSLSILDEPYSDPSIVPSFILSKEISKYFKVAISGDGGDELLGGYRRTFLTLGSKSFSDSLLSKAYYISPGIFGSGSTFLSKSKNNEQSYSSTLADEKFIKMLKRTSNFYTNNILLNENMDLYKSLLVNDYKFFLPEQMLYKVDRTSMANSLEVRSPFLDHNLIQYIMSHDISYVDKNNPKAILKNLLYTDFNSEFINRKKQGFVFDMESWIYNNKPVINETLSNGKIVGNYFTNPINKLSLYKSRINALRIWKLYTLENYFLGI